MKLATSMKRLFQILIFVFVVHYVSAQDAVVAPKDEAIDSKEFRFSIFLGWPIGAAKYDIEEAMISSGFNKHSPSNMFGSGNNHPFTRNYPVFDIELTYFINQHSGVSLNGGIADNIEVFGYHNEASYLFIKSELWSGSLNYVYRSKNNRHAGFIGPIIVFYNASRSSSGSDDAFSSYDVNKFGVYTGYTYNFLQKRVFLMAFKLNVRWAGNAEIGPFYEGYGDRMYELPVTSVSLTTVNIGLSFGFRNGKPKQ